MPNLVESIDRPIRPLVINMNRIGLPTVFSCCGFPYKDEEEPKSHSYKRAYVIFKVKPEMYYPLFDWVSYAAHKMGWEVGRYADNWRIDFTPPNNNGKTREYYIQSDEDKNTYAIHDYETLTLAIYGLNKELDKIPSVSDKFVLTDGNQLYHDLGIDWNVEPKEEMVIETPVAN